MTENPYQPPQTTPPPRPTLKAVAGFGVLLLLSIPACVVAGMATCMGVAKVTGSFMPGVIVSVVGSWGTVVAIMLLAEALADSQATAKVVMREVTLGFLAALLPAVMIVLVGGFAALMHAEKSHGHAERWLGVLPGAVAHLVLGCGGMAAWWHWRRKRYLN